MDRRYTYNVTKWRVRGTILAAGKQNSLEYPACNVHDSYCHLCPVRLYNIFSHLANGTIFEKKKILLYIKCVF